MQRLRPRSVLALTLGLALGGSALVTPRAPASGTVTVGAGHLLRPGQPVGPLTLCAEPGAALAVTTAIDGVTVHAAELTCDDGGVGVLDLSELTLPPGVVTGSLTVTATESGETVVDYAPPIANLERDEGVVAELPATGGEPVASSGFASVPRSPPSTTTHSVVRPDDDGPVPGDGNPPTLFGELLPLAGMAGFGDCPAPVLVEAVETTTTEMTPVVADPVFA